MTAENNFKIRVGIVGSAGYTGGELIRLLLNHPHVDLVFAHSESQAGKPLYTVHTDLLGDTDLTFASTLDDSIDVLFLCVGHGNARAFLEKNPVAEHIKIIDLSQDFRLKDKAHFMNRDFIYGLPELYRKEIKDAKNIANPGCFATTIELALLPMAHANHLRGPIHVHATTGSTGAGQAPGATTHFSWRNNNLSVYNAFTHRHLHEIRETLTSPKGYMAQLHFIPQRGAFSRGILAAVSLETEATLETLVDLYKQYYQTHPFTHVSEAPIDLKQVVNTNKCFLHLQKQENQLLIVSISDNLLKGASGQAVQNMNLLFGLEETAGLKLKASAF